MELLFIAIGIVVLAALGAAATWMGTDSRDLSDDPRRSRNSAGIA